MCANVVGQIAHQLEISKEQKDRYLICYGGANIESVINIGVLN
jgi:hypothetical protein